MHQEERGFTQGKKVYVEGLEEKGLAIAMNTMGGEIPPP